MPPRLARLLALFVAVALVVAAFAVRSRVADDGGDGGDGGEAGSDGNGDGAGGSNGDLVVVCVTELADVCAAVDQREDGVAVRVEAAAATAAALVAADAGADRSADAWLTLDPWPAMVDVERASANRDAIFSGDQQAVAASSDLMVLAFPERIEPCGDPVPASCLVEQVSGDLNFGVPSSDEALGVVAIGQLAAGLARATDFDIGAFRTEHGRELEDILESADPGPSATQARLLVQQGPGKYGAVSTTEVIARPLAESPRGVQSDLIVVAGEPRARADAVVAPLVGSDRGDQVRDLLTGKTAQEAFADAGWDRPADGPTGLPPADVLVALREEIG